jgi:hypothetical protein
MRAVFQFEANNLYCLTLEKKLYSLSSELLKVTCLVCLNLRLGLNQVPSDV